MKYFLLRITYSVIASSAVDREFKPKTKIGICCFSTEHAA